MKDSPLDKAPAESTTIPKSFGVLQAAIAFIVTMAIGLLITGVTGLFVYANVADPKSRDFQFVVIALIGCGISLTLAWFAARRTLEQEAAMSTGPAIGLLRKYRRAVTQTGADAQAGQYHIGENYLRELLGRRGA